MHIGIIAARLCILLHYIELCSLLQVQTIKGYSHQYNGLYNV